VRWRGRLAVIVAILGCAIVLAACGGATHTPLFAIQGADADNGPSAMQKYCCISCHTVPGVSGVNGRAAPPLDHWTQRAYIAGEVPNEPDALIQWIRDPQSIEPGTAMPNLGVTEADARDIAAYLYSLK
jgi:cytochrome c1